MKKLIINFSEYQKLIGNICRELAISKWKPDYVVGVTRGGLTPAVMISHYLNVPMRTLSVSLRDHEYTESNLWMAEDAYGYSGVYNNTPIYDEYRRKNILIVDDINDTGATFNWIVNDWQTNCLPNSDQWKSVWNNSVKFAAVVNNHASESIVKMDFVGMDVDKAKDDVWIEFPYESWWKI